MPREESRSWLECHALEGDSPVGVTSQVMRWSILSTVDRKFRGKLGGINPQG